MGVRRATPLSARRARLVALFVVLGAVLSAGCTAADSSPKLRGVETQPQLDVAAVSLPDVSAANAPFAMKAADGGLIVVYFGYTACPDICPTTLSDVAAALEKVGAKDAARVQVAMVTVDPERDTAPVLTAYVEHFFADNGHALRTDDADELRRATDAFGVRAEIAPHQPGEPYEVAHTAITYVIDDRGRVVVQWPFGSTPADMASDLEVLLNKEQS